MLARAQGLAGFSKLVALKRMHAEYAKDEVIVARFVDEAKIAARLDHPNLVQVFDFGVDDGEYYIAMEYVHGVSLAQLAATANKRGEILPMDFTLSVIIAACEGLSHAHDLRGAKGHTLGIVHRDVSPANVMLSYDGEVKVADFGIARAEERRAKTLTGVVLGKLAYMSPEQMAGTSVDRRTDVFALGVVMHELLTGRRLFSASRSAAGVRPRPDAPSALNPLLPRDLDTIVLRTLCERASERIATCDLLRAELEAVLARHGKSPSSRRRAALMRAWYPELAAGPEAPVAAARGHLPTPEVQALRAREPRRSAPRKTVAPVLEDPPTRFLSRNLAPSLHAAATLALPAFPPPPRLPRLRSEPLLPMSALLAPRDVASEPRSLAWTLRAPERRRPRTHVFEDLIDKVPWEAIVACLLALALFLALAIRSTPSQVIS